jgi:LPXTG-motif cell wall-anchored protein
MRFGFTACLVMLFTLPAWALKTAYVSFDQPEKWQCELSQGVWICQSNLDLDRKESVILSIATLATEWDTLDNYEEYLKKPRSIQDETGNTIETDVKYVRRRNINGFVWVDSLQFNSELPGFWARYLSTVQNKYAILITYIVSDDHYKQLAPQFEHMVASLKPNKELDLNVASHQDGSQLPGANIMGPKRQEILKGLLNTKKPKAPEAPPSGGTSTIFLLAIGAAAVAGIVIMRRRRKQPRKKIPPTQPPSPPVRRAQK